MFERQGFFSYVKFTKLGSADTEGDYVQKKQQASQISQKPGEWAFPDD